MGLTELKTAIAVVDEDARFRQSGAADSVRGCKPGSPGLRGISG